MSDVNPCSINIEAMSTDVINPLLYNNNDQCPICLENSDNPKVFPCLHVVCSACVRRVASGLLPGQTFACPVCRRQVRVPIGGVDQLNNVDQLRQVSSTWLTLATEGRLPKETRLRQINQTRQSSANDGEQKQNITERVTRQVNINSSCFSIDGK